jgi:hypothetical protein
LRSLSSGRDNKCFPSPQLPSSGIHPAYPVEIAGVIPQSLQLQWQVSLGRCHKSEECALLYAYISVFLQSEWNTCQYSFPYVAAAITRLPCKTTGTLWMQSCYTCNSFQRVQSSHGSNMTTHRHLVQTRAYTANPLHPNVAWCLGTAFPLFSTLLPFRNYKVTCHSNVLYMA